MANSVTLDAVINQIESMKFPVDTETITYLHHVIEGASIYSLRYAFLVGSKVFSGIHSSMLSLYHSNECNLLSYVDDKYEEIYDKLSSTKDVDVMFYYWGDKKASKHRNKVNAIFYSNRAKDVDIDLVVNMDAYKVVKEGRSVIDYMLKENRSKFSTSLGAMKQLNLDGLFVTKLTILNKRDKDFLAMRFIYDIYKLNKIIKKSEGDDKKSFNKEIVEEVNKMDFYEVIPPHVKELIEYFDLRKEVDELKEHLN